MNESLTMAKALNRGLRRALQADPKVLLAGEDIGKLGGVFRITEGLQAEFGENRVIDSLLASRASSEPPSACACAVTAPSSRSVRRLRVPGFAQIVTQVAKFHMRTGGQRRCRW